VAAIGREVVVDVDRAPAAGEGDMVLRGQVLVADEEDAMFGERGLDGRHAGVVEGAQVDAEGLDTAMFGEGA
jgi:hypothetical protein